MDGWMDGWIDEWMDGRTDGQTDRRMNGWIYNDRYNESINTCIISQLFGSAGNPETPFYQMMSLVSDHIILPFIMSSPFLSLSLAPLTQHLLYFYRLLIVKYHFTLTWQSFYR